MSPRLPALLLGGLLLVARTVQAQDSLSFRIDDARTPSAPAFALLDLEPTAIERPTTPRALAVSLISATDQGSMLPQNYALAIAPYWLGDHPTLTFDQYYAAGLGRTMLQSLSLSLATARSGDSGATALGFGLRTLVAAGHASPFLATERERLTLAQTAFLLAVDSLDQLREQLAALPAGDRCDRPCARARDALTRAAAEAATDSAAAVAAIRPIALGIQQLDHARVGWAIELAGAVSARFPEGSWDNAEVDRIGIWLTPSYRPADDHLDFMAVGRFLRTLPSGVEASLLDIGGRVRWDRGPLSLSGEWIYRSRNPDAGPTTTSVRAVALLDYTVSRDLRITGSFGQNYDSDVPGARPLVAQLGIDVGLGRMPLVGIGE